MPASILPMNSSTGGNPTSPPSFKGLCRSFSADPNIPLPVYIRRYHSEAYKSISEALAIDEEDGRNRR